MIDLDGINIGESVHKAIAAHRRELDYAEIAVDNIKKAQERVKLRRLLARLPVTLRHTLLELQSTQPIELQRLRALNPKFGLGEKIKGAAAKGRAAKFNPKHSKIISTAVK